MRRDGSTSSGCSATLDGASGSPSKVASSSPYGGQKIDDMAVIRFVLLIAFVTCANRANTTPGNAADCTTEEIAALAARAASSAYQDIGL